MLYCIYTYDISVRSGSFRLIYSGKQLEVCVSISINMRDLLALQLTDRRVGGLIDRHGLTEYTVDADTISKMMYNL